MKCRVLIVSLVCSLCASVAWAGGFSKLPIGARVVTLGGSLVSVADDPNVLFYNPAGIASLPSLTFSTSYTRLFTGLDDNLRYFTGSVALRLGFVGTVGVGLKAFMSDAWKENELVASYGVELAEILTVGGSVKALHWSSAPPAGRLAAPEAGMSHVTMAFDAGAQSLIRDIFPNNDIRVGIAFNDINRPSIAKNGSADAKLDLKMSLGVTYISHTYDYVATFHYTVAGPVKRYGIGAEFVALKATMMGQEVVFLVRAGGGGLAAPGKQGDINGGFGIRLAGVTMDYAYAHQTELLYVGGTHHVTLRYGL
jgi:hypothetical protein